MPDPVARAVCHHVAMIRESVTTADSRTTDGLDGPHLRRNNPYQVALLAVGGFTFVLAFMLWVVIAQMTDYLTYDVVAVAEVTAWMYVLIGTGIAAMLGAVVIAGVSWAIRHGATDRAGS